MTHTDFHLTRRTLMAGAAATGAALSFGLSAGADPASKIGLVAPPNPHTFPLLLAMQRDPGLPVRLIPVATSGEVDPLLASGEASGALLMSYIAAKKQAGGSIPDLQLARVTLWRGFYHVAGRDVSKFADLRGKTVLVSGPLGAGRGGGGDIIFRAAVRRQCLDPDTDLVVDYAPISEGAARVASGEAAGITVPGPASTGLVLRAEVANNPLKATMARARGMKVGPSVPLKAAIDFQKVFSGYQTFPEHQLPLGGFCFTARAQENSARRAAIEKVMAAYDAAARLIMEHPKTVAETVSAEFTRYYGPLGAGGPPPMVLTRAISDGDLVYRTDMAVADVKTDLAAWLGELNGTAPGSEFFSAG